MTSKIVDTHVWLSRWPFRRLRGDDTQSLIQSLRKEGVRKAIAGSFDMVLHCDLDAVNARLAEECRESGGLLLPAGSVNLSQPWWKEDFQRCVSDHGMTVLRVLPSYHGWSIDSPEFKLLLDAATQSHIVVQISVRLEDPRTHHPLVQIPDADLKPLPSVLKDFPAARVQVLNGLSVLPLSVITILVETTQVWFDHATLEGVAGLDRIVKTVPSERLVFGSHSPFFHWESALLKFQESELPTEMKEAIQFRNAEAIFLAQDK